MGGCLMTEGHEVSVVAEAHPHSFVFPNLALCSPRLTLKYTLPQDGSKTNLKFCILSAEQMPCLPN